MQKFFSQIKDFLKFLKSTDFSRGVLMVGAAISALAVTKYFDVMHIGVAMAIGALTCSPSDITGSLRRRNIGLLFAILLVFLASLIAGYAAGTVVFVPVLALLMFSISMISVYGFRSSLIAFSGLFAVVLSMANIPSGESVLVHSVWIALGGLWYLLLSNILHFLNPGKQSEEILSETFELTAKYLKVRAELVLSSVGQREDFKRELFTLQTSINEKHETIRELVISRRVKSGKSGDARKKMLIFMELVDILELSMANPVNYEQMDELFKEHKDTLEIFRKWSIAMANELLALSAALKTDEKYVSQINLETLRKQADESIVSFRDEVGLPRSRKAVLVLRSMFDFKDKQQEKIFFISRLLRGQNFREDLSMRNKDAVKFITSQEYNSKTLQDNFDFNSPIFRHSLRLVAVMVAGYLLGSFFELQNTYWILLTSLVIMRPGYSLTRERSKQRLYGTLIGGGIATIIILITQNPVFLGILAVICLVFALAMMQRNYKASAALITLNIIFVYSLMRPDAFTVIEFRMLDTVIGTALAFLGNSFLWPTWEYKGIKSFVVQSIAANRAYLQEIINLYQQKERLPASYKLARKRAFLAIGNLNSAFQRMTQEPKSRQKNLQGMYEIVSLNQEFLSSAASLGTFIATHSTTKSSEHFRVYIETILENLSETVDHLQGEKLEKETRHGGVEEAESYFRERYDELVELRNREVEAGKSEISAEMRTRFQEAQLVIEQLKWMLQISRNLKAQVYDSI